MQHIDVQYYTSPVGELILGTLDNKLCLCDWRYRDKRKTIDNRLQQKLKACYQQKDNAMLKQVRSQLSQYFLFERSTFNLPLLLAGTPFQKKVWQALLTVPFGVTSSYLQLAQSINQAKSVRAVANANGANAIAIIIPCHRIINTNGKLGGYAGGLKTKKKLLALEQYH